MTRKEQIEKQSKQFEQALAVVDGGDAYSFIQGAEWADRNPKEAKAIDENLSAEEIDCLIDDYNIQLRKLRKLSNEKLIEKYNFTNKFVFIPDYGYMYVTWQKYDTSVGNGEGHIHFQGVGFYSEFAPYQDGNYFSYNAMEDWFIPIRTFENIVRNIEIVDEKYFVDKFEGFAKQVADEFKSMLKALINDNRETEKGS